MKRLVVVSNRVADLNNPNQAGGLAVGLGDALRRNRGMWFGWDGKTVARGVRVPPEVHQINDTTTVTLPMTRKDHEEFYAGFSNSVLWPLLHYRLDLVDFKPAFLRGYKRVNSKFSNALSPYLQPDDTIWVHDYHLIPLGQELRRRGHRQRIGFFLHIPFPPPDILTAVPEHGWLVRSMFAYDLVGFQTTGDVSNFCRYIVDYLGAVDVGDDTFELNGNRMRVGCFPIGIDAEAFYAMAHTAEADATVKMLRQRNLSRLKIIGVDRLDYSKGLPERMQAFRRLLELYPDNVKKVTLMQIAPPTREAVDAYADIRLELEALSGAINGQFADFDWTPLRYIHRPIPRSTLAALFRGSHVGLVSPLRDGMNLVAKEYIAAQDRDNPGVVVLSKFAGAAEELREALIVNPYDIDDMAENLQRALTMPLGERLARHKALLARVCTNNAEHWQQGFLAALNA